VSDIEDEDSDDKSDLVNNVLEELKAHGDIEDN
jgi:hypothetical protein